MRSGIVQAAEASGPSWGVWITAAGVVVTAVAAAIATAYTANKKVREVELSYAQRLQDSYLNNAREYLQSVYLPLHLAVTDLVEAHRDFRAHADRAAGTAPDDALAAFQAAIDRYDTTVAGLLGRAAGAFLTTALEERLEEFTHFVRSSRYTTATRVRVAITLAALGSRISREFTVPRRLPVSMMSWRYLNVGFSVDQQRTVAAPLPSIEFDRAFTEEVTVLRALIKEVTLGAHARSAG
jgi:hypothetical protein